MVPLILLAAAVAAFVAAVLVLRSFGTGYRVGRLLASAPRVSVGEALRIAAGTPQRYVRVEGRIDAEEDFDDAAHRPLVLRRTRLQFRDARSWTTFEEGLEQVPFTVREGLDAIAVDAAALDEGLVVVPRESIGTAADLGERRPEALAPETPVRAIVDHVSSVEHAIVAGVPVAADGGHPRMTAGLGRPLILTTLQSSEAMRILAGGDGRRARIVAGLFALAAVLLVAALAAAVIGYLLPPATAAASPAASPTAPAGGGTRSPGEGPGLVGDPLWAIAIVALIGLTAMIATLAFIRLGRRGGPEATEQPDTTGRRVDGS